jgi:alpha-tubulin suppressor-like RCC1 family protein/uncharacterized protein YjdB
MTHPRRLFVVTALTAVLVNCSEAPPGGGQGDDGDDIPETPWDTSMKVSDPIVLTGVLAADGVRILAAEEQNVVYVSLPDSAVPNGARAYVRRVGDELPFIINMKNGGFDPVAVRAEPADSVEIVVKSLSGSTVYSTKKPVNPSRPPIVVRTWPPRKKSDTPVNASIVIVFSEPIDENTVNANSVRLMRGQTQVDADVSFVEGDGTTMVIDPTTSLLPNRQHRIVIGTGVTDDDGQSVESQMVIGFATGTSSLGAPDHIYVTPDSSFLLVGQTYQLTARVFDANGNVLPDQTVTWDNFDPSLVSITPSGLVTALATESGQTWGNADLSARVGDVSYPVNIIVVPVPASIEITSPSTSVALGDTLAFEVITRDASGSRIFPPLTVTTSNAAVAKVDVPAERQMVAHAFRTLRPVAEGSTTITVRAGSVSATMDFTVAPPRAVDKVRVAPAAIELAPSELTRLTAWLWDANGVEIQGRTVSWTSSNTGVATVDASGAVTSVSIGTATITAARDGKIGSASITVTSDPVLRFASVNAMSPAGRICGVTTTADAYCWGRVPLGDGDFSVEQKTRPTLVRGGFDFASIQARGCGTTTSRDLLCWTSGVPVRVNLPVALTLVSMGEGHFCGLDSSGKAYCWGNNFLGQLGDGSQTNRADPTAVSGNLTFTTIQASASFTCGLTTASDAYCWGTNSDGRLGSGSGSTSPATVPTLVAGGHKFSQLSAGLNHVCGVTQSGAAYCWGQNFNGKLGDGTEVNSNVPVAVTGGRTFASISAGGTHTCALTTDGSAYCWGNNFAGQLGVNSAELCGSTACSRQPVAVQGSLAFERLATGAFETCGITPTARLYCWGQNFVGQLGDGTFTNRSAPTPVARP